ncbi:MAG: site-specific integrase [Planctomycetota bacterium]
MTSKKIRKNERPDKPYPEFPLTASGNGQWCRKIRGKIHYFGPWEDWQNALDNHNQAYPYLKAGIEPPDSFEGLTIAQLCNRFMTHKKSLLTTGEISQRWFDDMLKACEVVVDNFGKQRIVETLTPIDFEKLRTILVEGKSPTVAKNFINRIRSVFKFAEENDLIEKRVKFGTGFKPPSKAVIRKYRNSKPKKLFTPDDFQKLIKFADVHLKAMVLIAMNAGLNNTDVCQLQTSHVDFDTGWVDYPRPKTGIQRRFKLWPETTAALRASFNERYEPHEKEHQSYFFITKFGNPWHPRNSLAKQFAKLCKDCNVSASFQYFRHTFETVAAGAKDQVAVDYVMGHVDNSMASEYREEVGQDRLEAVSCHVRNLLLKVE